MKQGLRENACYALVFAGTQPSSKRADGGTGNLQLLLQGPDSPNLAAILTTEHQWHTAAV